MPGLYVRHIFVAPESFRDFRKQPIHLGYTREVLRAAISEIPRLHARTRERLLGLRISMVGDLFSEMEGDRALRSQFEPKLNKWAAHKLPTI